VAFATQPVGVFGVPEALTITNSGHGNLQIDAARVADGDVDDFLVSYDTCSQSTLTIGATCTIHVRFVPSGSGDRRAMLALASDDPASPLQIELKGTVGPLPQGPAAPADSPGPAGAAPLPPPGFSQSPKERPAQALRRPARPQGHATALAWTSAANFARHRTAPTTAADSTR